MQETIVNSTAREKLSAGIKQKAVR